MSLFFRFYSKFNIFAPAKRGAVKG